MHLLPRDRIFRFWTTLSLLQSVEVQAKRAAHRSAFRERPGIEPNSIAPIRLLLVLGFDFSRGFLIRLLILLRDRPDRTRTAHRDLQAGYAIVWDSSTGSDVEEF